MMLLALLLAASPPAETPKAWMERVYAQYRSSPDFSPFKRPRALLRADPARGDR
jgi:hypothetical protein